jgi:hypothetical protein
MSRPKPDLVPGPKISKVENETLGRREWKIGTGESAAGGEQKHFGAETGAGNQIPGAGRRTLSEKLHSAVSPMLHERETTGDDQAGTEEGLRSGALERRN